MAEIKIEKTRHLWLWVIVALIIAGIIYFIMTSRDINSEKDIVPMERDSISGAGTGYNSLEDDPIYSTAQEELNNISFGPVCYLPSGRPARLHRSGGYESR